MSRISRLLKIIKIFGQYRLDDFIPRGVLHWMPSGFLKMNPWKIFPSTISDKSIRLRRGLEELGPVFIKFGQTLSTRRDLLPEEIVDELLKLVDNVPAFSEEQAVSIMEKALGGKTSYIFSEFDNTPFASASVAQVHSAILNNGKEVVVKIIRPKIEKIIRQDIALLFGLARFIKKYFRDGKRLRPLEIVADYESTIIAELDLTREAANASQLKRNSEERNLVYVPEVFWEYTSKHVCVMEKISGIPITDIDTLKSHNTNLKLLAERGVEIFFTQVFKDNFFHADMHPGNIFVDISNPDDPTYISIDCAIIGSLSNTDQYYLARKLLASFKRNYREVAELHVECGWVPIATNVHNFESTMRALCEPVFERPIKDISFGELLVNLFKTARSYDMEVQPSLVLLQKTLLNIEGLGRQLYPDLNLWDTALPFLEKWLRERYSPLSVLQRLQKNVPSWLEKLPELPEAIYNNLTEATNLKKEIEVCNEEIKQLRDKIEFERSFLRLIAILSIAIVISVPIAMIITPSLTVSIP